MTSLAKLNGPLDAQKIVVQSTMVIYTALVTLILIEVATSVTILWRSVRASVVLFSVVLAAVTLWRRATSVGGLVDGRRKKNTRLGDGPWFTFVTSEMRGWRDAMEDASVATQLSPDLACFAVFDGHGGGEASRLVGKWMPSLIRAGEEEPQQALTKALQEAELRLLAQQGFRDRPPARSAQGKGSLFDFQGCTACVTLLTRHQLTVANVGDSRAFLCRAGVCVPLSRDHKPESPRERKRIILAGGRVVQMGPCYRVDFGLNMSRSLGDFEYKDPQLRPEDQKISPTPDVITTEIDPRDEFLCIACDGLFELMGWDDVCGYIHARIGKQPLEEIAHGLLDACMASNPMATGGYGTDNESVVIVKLDHEAKPV